MTSNLDTDGHPSQAESLDDMRTLPLETNPEDPAAASAPATSMTAAGANPDSPVPFVFGNRIAQGAMGAILTAKDCKLGRTIAVKVMLDEAGVNEEQQLRFVQEAAVLGKLQHPNIVPVYDLGRDASGSLYYSMKLVKGRTLQDILDDLRDEEPAALAHYTLDRLLTIFRKICDALAFAHAENIIHRDLKPENIMVGEFGEVLVMDWGLSKILDGSSEIVSPESMAPRPEVSASASVSATLEGSVMGTPQYMSPEQAAGEIGEMDSRSDIYSLGGLLYAILTLRPPVVGKDVYEVLDKVQAGEVAPPSKFGTTILDGKPTEKDEVLEAKKVKPLPHIAAGKVPGALSSVAMKALSLKKERRYQDVASFSEDIEKWQGGFATSAEEAGFGKQVALLIKRNKTVFTTAVAAWAIITALAVWFVVGMRAKEQRALAGEAAARQGLAKSAIALADAAYLDGDGQRALKHLEECPEQFRDTHWDYVKRYSDEAIYRVPSPDANLRGLVADPLAPGAFYLLSNLQTKEESKDTVGTISRIDGRTGGVQKVIKTRSEHFLGNMAISPDGAHIALVSTFGESEVQLFQTNPIRLEKEWLIQDFARANNHFFSADSKSFFMSNSNETVSIDLLTGEQLRVPGLSTKCADPDRSLVYGIEDRKLVVYNQTTRQSRPVSLSSLGGATTMAISPDKKFLVAGTAEGLIHLYNAKNGELIKTLHAYKNAVFSVRFSEDSSILLSLGRDDRRGAVRLWSVESRSYLPLRTVFSQEYNWGASVAWDERSNLMLTAFTGLAAFALPMDASTRIGRGGGFPRFSDESTLGVSRTDKKGVPTLTLLDIDSNQSRRELPSYSHVIRSRTNDIVTAGWIDYTTNNPTRTFPNLIGEDPWKEAVTTVYHVDELAVSPKGRFIAAAAPDSIRVSSRSDSGKWETVLDLEADFEEELPSGVILHQIRLFFPEAPRPLLLVSFLIQGEETDFRSYRLYDIESRQLLRSRDVPSAALCMLLDPSGQTLFVATPNGSIVTMDPITLEERFTVRAHDRIITSLAIHPDGKVLATGDANGLVRFWRLEDGRPIEMTREWIGNVGQIDSLDFSPSGLRLVSLASGQMKMLDWSNEHVKPPSQTKDVDDGKPLDWQVAIKKAGIIPKGFFQLPDGTWNLNLEKSEISDLAILRGAPIGKLGLQHTPVTTLEPLRGMKLTALSIPNTRIADLSPLAGMPLRDFVAVATLITDLSVLRGMPLTSVRLHKCAELTDLSPLADCPELRALSLPPNAKDIEFLRSLPNLERISYSVDLDNGYIPDMTAAEFWKEYDATKN